MDVTGESAGDRASLEQGDGTVCSGRAARWPSAVTVVVLALLGSALALHVSHLSGVVEDAFITIRYARHLAAGDGFVWNVGEPPIEGFTSPLWLALLAAAIRFGVEPATAAQLLGASAAAATLALTVAFARRWLRLPRWAAWSSAALLVSSGPFAAWAAGGLETPAFGLALLATAAAAASHAREQSPRALAWVAAGIVTALLLRPEAAAHFAVVLGWQLVVAVSRRRWPRGAVVRFVLPVLLAMAALTAWRLATFGDWLPNTYHAKTGGGREQLERGFEYVRYFALHFVTPLVPAWLLAGVVGWSTAGRRRGDLRAWIDRHAVVLLCVAVVLGQTIVVVLEGGDYMAMYRFLSPITPFLALLFGVALTAIRKGFTGWRRQIALPVVFCLAVAGTLVHSTPFEKALFDIPPRQHGTYRGVLTERWHVARLRAVGRFFEAQRAAPADALATRAIGVLGDVWQGRVDDLTGLTDRHIARRRSRTLGRGWAGHEKMDLGHSFGKLPRFVELDRALSREPIDEARANVNGSTLVETLRENRANYPRTRFFLRWMERNAAFVGEHYRLRTAWLDDSTNGESGYLVYLERRSASPVTDDEELEELDAAAASAPRG